MLRKENEREKRQSTEANRKSLPPNASRRASYRPSAMYCTDLRPESLNPCFYFPMLIRNVGTIKMDEKERLEEKRKEKKLSRNCCEIEKRDSSEQIAKSSKASEAFCATRKD
jgi:hypothetical protein